MRTALLLSGHFRDANSCFPYIKEKILDLYDADVFISTWNPEGDFENYIPVPTRNLENSYTFDQIIKAYKPKMIKSEDLNSPKIQTLIARDWDLDTFGPMNGEFNTVSIFCMWYKITSAFHLMEEYESECNFKYDFIIKGRFDLKIYDHLQIKENTNYVNIPCGFDWRGGYNDLIAWGSREAMIYYGSLLLKMEQYVKSDGVFFHPETLLKHHLLNSPYGVNRPDTRIGLRDKNIWEIENLPGNDKLLTE